MIYTVTFNPAIDYTVSLENLQTGAVNRCQSEQMTFGGKGINVSCVLRELGCETTALGFCAGFTGKAIADGLEEKGVPTDLVRLSKGNSRINVKISADSETEINGRGPDISESELDEFYGRLSQIKDGDTIVLAGSVPQSMPQDVYSRILERLSGRDISAAVDAEGSLLMETLRFRPFVIKPNSHELGQIFGKTLTTDEQIAECARELQSKGARNVLVSMAKDGSLLLDESGKLHRQGICKGQVVSSVGAGDSMLAGFIAGFAQTDDYDYALRLATACGGATAFSVGTAKKELITELLTQLEN